MERAVRLGDQATYHLLRKRHNLAVLAMVR
jgi:hypothetical protein